MKKMRICAALLGLALAAGAGDLAIQSFSGTGQLSFGELPDATSYRVEWAPTPAGPWKDFPSAAAALHDIAAKGQGSVTCSVPMCYRVVAALLPATPTSFTLAGGGATTTVRTVTLDHAYTGRPVYYLASEDTGFAGASWQVWAGSPAYTLSAGDGVKTVYLKLRNAAGEVSAVISDTITYIEPVPPSITQQPQSATTCVSSNVTFSVSAAGTAPLSYQWQFNGTNLVWATDSGLTLTNLLTADAGTYRALISNAYGSVTSAVAVLTVTEWSYLVVDLSGGPSATNYPVSYLAEVPGGGWTDEYKTTKLVLRKVPATAPNFTMGSPSGELGRNSDETQHAVTLSQGFYVCVFEVTQRQWERVTGTWPSYFNSASYRDARPVERVSYNDLRGSSAGAGWPANNSVDATSFLGLLRAKTGLAFDLPTESQWEYACRAGTTAALNSGYNLTNPWGNDPQMQIVGRYWYNGGSAYSQGGDTSVGSAKVGSYLPNAWGLYDMHGNVWEWCLDWYGTTYPGSVTDPKGASSGSDRVNRGGSWFDYAGYCRSAYRRRVTPDYVDERSGFRVAMPQAQQ